MAPRSSESLDSTNQYLNEIGRYELLTAEDEVELAKRMETGKQAMDKLEELNGNTTEEYEQELMCIIEAGHQARAEFISANLRLVVSIANRFSRRPKSSEFLDLIQAGNEGLHTAVDKFDYKRGFKFSTYATWWIHQAIDRYMKSHDRTIRIPVHIESDLQTINKARQKFIIREGRQPTAEEAAEEAELPINKVAHVMKVEETSADVSSYDTPLKEEDKSAEWIDFMEDADVDVEKEATGELVRKAILDMAEIYLKENERAVITMHYGLDGGDERSLAEIGRELGLTRERTRQIRTKALAKLRKQENMESLYDHIS